MNKKDLERKLNESDSLDNPNSTSLKNIEYSDGVELNNLTTYMMLSGYEEVRKIWGYLSFNRDMLITMYNRTLKDLFDVEYDLLSIDRAKTVDARDDIYNLYISCTGFMSTMYNINDKLQFGASYLLMGPSVIGTSSDGAKFFKKKYALANFPEEHSAIKDLLVNDTSGNNLMRLGRNETVHGWMKKIFYITQDPMMTYVDSIIDKNFNKNVASDNKMCCFSDGVAVDSACVNVNNGMRTTIRELFTAKMCLAPERYVDNFKKLNPYNDLSSISLDELRSLYINNPSAFNSIIPRSQEVLLLGANRENPTWTPLREYITCTYPKFLSNTLDIYGMLIAQKDNWKISPDSRSGLFD